MLHYWNFMVPFYIEYLGCDCKYRDSGISEGRYQQLFNLILMVISGYQMAVSDSLVTSIAITMAILGIYVNTETPSQLEHERYRGELVYGFANVIEGRDGSTGGHVKCTDSILQKPGKLTAEEFEVMKLHTVNGAKIVRKSLARLGDAQYIDVVHDIVLYHHEKWNGAGYPEGIGSSFDPLIAEAFFGQ